MFNELLDHIHPILVHFPIAIISIALIFDVILAIRLGSIPAKSGIFLWIAAALGTWLSVATGPEEEAYGNTDFLDIHSTLADITAWMVTILIAWRLWMIWKGNRPFVKATLFSYLIISILSCILVLTTGYYGGKMVYEDGVGVKQKGSYVNPSKTLHK